MISDCNPGKPIPLLTFHGQEDSIVTYATGKTAVEQWIENNGCSGTVSKKEEYNQSYCEWYEDCEDGASVVFCTMTPMGHCWPSGSSSLCLPGVGPFNSDIDANDYMWKFFQQFTLP